MRSPSRTPNTARRITSSVIACIRGRSENAVPTGQRSTSAAAAAAIVSTYRRTACPWNGGSTSLRCDMWRPSSSVSSEFSPRLWPSAVALASPA
jgi:hypothetical protein